MKTTLTILIILMTFMAAWSACQLDTVNVILSAISVPVLIISYITSTILDNETKEEI